MGLLSSNAFRLTPLRLKAGGAERRRAPRYEAIGPGEMLDVHGDPIASFRLVDEGDQGLGCVSPAEVEPGQIVRVRVGLGSRWRPAVVTNVTPCGPLRRIGLAFTEARSAGEIKTRAA